MTQGYAMEPNPLTRLPQFRKTPVIKKSLAAIRDGDCYGELTFIYSTGDPTKMEAAEKETEKNESEGENEANW